MPKAKCTEVLSDTVTGGLGEVEGTVMALKLLDLAIFALDLVGHKLAAAHVEAARSDLLAHVPTELRLAFDAERGVS